MKNIKLFLGLILSVAPLIWGMENAPRETFVFSHGFGSTAKKVEAYIDHEILPPGTQGPNYQDARLKLEVIRGMGAGLNIWDSCLGQKPDVEVFDNYVKGLAKGRGIFFGESRGASLLLNWLGSKSPNLDKAEAVICDSPFDSILHVLKHRAAHSYLYKLVSPKTLEYYLQRVCKYKADGMQPIHSAEHIPLEIPLLLICSREDTKVPAAGVVALYKKLRERGHNKVHLLQLDHGEHAWLMKGSKEYRPVIHAFRAHYGMSHNPEYAQQGKEHFLNQCQPKIEALK